MDLFRASWGLIWFCDQEAQKSHLWNPIRLQPWQGHDLRHVHPSESLCLPASKALSLHGRAVLLISGIWDYCKLNSPTWELLELQSFPWKRGSDRERELSTALLQGKDQIRTRQGRRTVDGWVQEQFLGAVGTEGGGWAVALALARNDSLLCTSLLVHLPACSCSLLVPLQSTLVFGFKVFHYNELKVVRARKSSPGNTS